MVDILKLSMAMSLDTKLNQQFQNGGLAKFEAGTTT
jgi:hypothetical protein